MSYVLSQEAVSFFMHSYFGIALDELESDNKEAVITKCAQRAYLDLSRTLEFTEKYTDKMSVCEKRRIQGDHNRFRDEICNVVTEQIQKHLLTSDKTNFDLNHKNACKEITCTARKSPVLNKNENGEKFYHGQAQKWLNMTMKYMWLTGLWKDEFAKLMPVIHIPVDSFIIEAIWHEKFDEDSNGWINQDSVKKLSVVLPCKNERVKNEKRRYKYASEKVKAWSQWDYKEYEDFQISLRKWCESQKTIPLLWEGPAWIEISNQRSSS